MAKRRHIKLDMAHVLGAIISGDFKSIAKFGAKQWAKIGRGIIKLIKTDMSKGLLQGFNDVQKHKYLSPEYVRRKSAGKGRKIKGRNAYYKQKSYRTDSVDLILTGRLQSSLKMVESDDYSVAIEFSGNRSKKILDGQARYGRSLTDLHSTTKKAIKELIMRNYTKRARIIMNQIIEIS